MYIINQYVQYLGILATLYFLSSSVLLVLYMHLLN